MSVADSAEHDELRQVVRKFLGERSPSREVRRLMEAGESHDDEVWALLAGQLGLTGIAVPERYGGAGYGPVELGIVLEEMGGALLVAPYFATVALAGQLLAVSGDEDAMARWLPGIADGSLTATLAVAEDSGSWDLAEVAATAEPAGDGWAVTGTKLFVIDGHTADLLLVVAHAPDGPGVFAVERGAAGVESARLDTLDLTRALASVALHGARAVRVGAGRDAAEWLSELRDLALAALAAEQLGGAARCLDMSVGYAKVREQFGRPIGSFQAIKHKCANLLLEVECGRSALYHASEAVAGRQPDAALAAALAYAYCSQAFTHAAKECIQIHGGIGYTWEHDAHLYLRRAKSSQLLFGPPARQRTRLAELAGICRTPMTMEREAPPSAAAPDDDFRARLREFFTTHHPGRPPKDPRERLAWSKAWLATLFDNGYAGPGWPREFGGMELPFGQQVIYQEELASARVPGPLGTGLNIAAPTIIKYGTHEQKQRWLAPMLRGDTVWAQGYSEPEAGSDLPSLRTTARREGDEYVVNGQKVWTSHAGDADILFALVRTGTRESRQKGITYLVIDARAPGVQVRPLRDLTGGHLFAEVFLDDVRVPAANRIGEENDGWRLARTSLGHERAAGALNQAATYRRVLTELEELARERGQLSDPLVRDRFVDLEIRVRIIRYNAERTIGGILARGEAGAASSISRLLITAFEQDIHEFAIDLLGPAGLLGKSAPQAVQRSRWLFGFLRTRASTIGAGTREIQLNTVAEQVLGLPHDPGMPPR